MFGEGGELKNWMLEQSVSLMVAQAFSFSYVLLSLFGARNYDANNSISWNVRIFFGADFFVFSGLNLKVVQVAP